ncbi:MAG: hypothetical protein AAF490_03595 [Chloroflexota bacterium]
MSLSEDEAAKEEEESASGPQAFSLPTRKPGETGELNPGLLPEWLRTGEHSLEDEEDESGVSGDPSERPKISTDELTHIEEIKSDNALTDDLPDWLLDQIDSEPIIPQSAGITTELYLDLVNNPDLPEIEDEVTKIEDEFGGEGANLPDWLQEPTDTNEAVEDAAESDEPVGLESDVDVLAGLTDILKEQTNELIPPDESGIGLTDWLSDPADKNDDQVQDDDEIGGSGGGLTDWLNDSAAVQDETGELSDNAGSGLTDILNDPDPFLDSEISGLAPTGDENTADQPQTQSGEGAGLTDWLTNLEELGDPNGNEDWLDDFSAQDAGASDWLEGLDKLTESQMNLEASADDDFEEDWLANLAESQSPAQDISEKDSSLSVTDWLSDPDGIEKFEEQIMSDKPAEDETAVSDAVGALFNDDFASGDAQDDQDFLSEHGNIPDWLSDDTGDSQEDETAQSELDWMFETGGVDLPEGSADEPAEASLDDLFGDLAQTGGDEFEADLFGESADTGADEFEADLFGESAQTGGDEFEADLFGEPDQEAPADNSFDWLSDMQDIQDGSLEVPDAPDESEQPDEEPEVAAAPSIEEDDEPQQPDPLEEIDKWDFGSDEDAKDPIPESLPDWMNELGPPVGNEPSEGFESEVSEEIESELPEWLTQMRPGDEGLIGSSLPSALNPDLVDDNALDLSDLPMELEKADLPDWLGNDEGGLPEILENESDDIPEWLVDSDTSTSRGDQRSDWDSSLLDKLPPPQAEPDLVEATIPDWLEKFKPEELKTGEVLLESTSGLAAVKEEVEAGAIAGLSGIIKIENPILPTKPSTTPSALKISADQTKQIELLRQLLQEDEVSAAGELPETAVSLPNFWNLIIILLIAVAVALVWVSPALFPLTLSTPELVGNEAYRQLENTSGQTVLMAFEHTPAMNGELNYQNEAILGLLDEQGNEIIAITQHPTTVGLLSDYEQINDDNLIYIPGEAVGLRLLGDCLGGNDLACRSFPALAQISQAEINTIVLVTSERDSLINWIEQIGTVAGERSILLSTTTALEPIARPYELTGQIDGIMTHQVVAAQDVSERTTEIRLRQQANAGAAAQMVAIILLIVVLFAYGIRRQPQSGGAS